MFRELQLTNFKNFRDATLELGPFTVLVGANASGKSNLRDAFRFLHGIGRGYDLIEILEEKYSAGSGERTWSGIRGGVTGASYKAAPSFELETHFSVPSLVSPYHLSVELAEQYENDQTVRVPRVESERLGDPNARIMWPTIYETEEQTGKDTIAVSITGMDASREKGENGPWPDRHEMKRHRPILGQLSDAYPDSQIGSASTEKVRDTAITRELFSKTCDSLT